jgi:hypothetical protein
VQNERNGGIGGRKAVPALIQNDSTCGRRGCHCALG